MMKDRNRNKNKDMTAEDIITKYEELRNSKKDTMAECRELVGQYRDLTETSTHKIARLLHEQFCNSNHVDQCSWYYETTHHGLAEDWTRPTHARYLAKAAKVEAAGFTYLDLLRLFEALNNQ